jgi:hypothetical protein
MRRSLGWRAHSVSGPGGRQTVPASRASLVLRRTLSAPLLPASLLLAVLTSVIVTTALANFGARALPTVAHQRLATTRAATVQVSGQIDDARARADLPVIRSSMRSALGAVPFTVLSGRWSDQLALPAASGQNRTALIQAAALDNVMAQTALVAGAWPGPGRPGAPTGVALPVTTAGMLHFSIGQVLVLRDSLTGVPARLRVTGLYRPRDRSQRTGGSACSGPQADSCRAISSPTARCW